MKNRQLERISGARVGGVVNDNWILVSRSSGNWCANGTFKIQLLKSDEKQSRFLILLSKKSRVDRAVTFLHANEFLI